MRLPETSFLCALSNAEEKSHRCYESNEKYAGASAAAAAVQNVGIQRRPVSPPRDRHGSRRVAAADQLELTNAYMISTEHATLGETGECDCRNQLSSLSQARSSKVATAMRAMRNARFRQTDGCEGVTLSYLQL